jgi:MFS family permease
MLPRSGASSGAGSAWSRASATNAYTLAFGGLLLLGGRIGDVLGRRRAFLGGVLLFALASLLGGLAPSGGWLLAMRALQGTGAAVTSPAVLALIATTFQGDKERNRTFGVFAGVSGAGAAIGLLAGGLLTQWLSWRWVLLVNVPVGVALMLLAPLFIAGTPGTPGRFDVSGAVTSALGVAGLVYGFIRAPQHGWRDTIAIISFAAAAALLHAFVAIERRTARPITPLRLFASRNRSGIYVMALALTGSLTGLFFFLTVFLQDALAFSPIRTGLAFLPVSLSIIVVAAMMTKLMPKIGQRIPLITGPVLITGALAWLSTLAPGTS